MQNILYLFACGFFFSYFLEQITTFLLSCRNLLPWVNYSTRLKDTFPLGLLRCLIRVMSEHREHNSQQEQLQAHPHPPPWSQQEQLGWAFIIPLGKSLLEVPSCKAFSSLNYSQSWSLWAAGTRTLGIVIIPEELAQKSAPSQAEICNSRKFSWRRISYSKILLICCGSWKPSPVRAL